MVLSRTDTPGNTSADELCRNGTPGGASLICFRPQGMDTRSEAATIADLVATNGWSSVVVVTSTYHVARAETLVRQCVDDARVTMASSEPELDPMGWLRRFVIETGGLLDVHLRPEC